MDTKAFLSAWDAGPDAVDFDALVDDFRKAMDDGLQGRPSSLGMIPAYVSIPERIPRESPVIVLDAGGTNFRTSLVSLDGQGKAFISDWQKTSMPGIDREVSAAQFFSAFADLVERLIDKSDHIGFCFSYAARITEERDGVPLLFSKEIKAREVIGKPVGKGLLDELARRGHEVASKKVTVVNDTVATLLATPSVIPPECVSGYMGLILGTGTNMAYVAQNRHIGKLHLTEGSQCINMESGNYAIAGGRLDREIFSATKDPQHYHFEKMISGAYLGMQCWHLMRHAVLDGQLFSPESAKALLAQPQWTTIQLSKFLADPKGSSIGEVLATGKDRAVMSDLSRAVVEKAAKLTACGITATVLQSGAGTSPERPVALNIDGTTYYQTKGLKEACERYLQHFLQEKRARYVRMLRVEDAPTIGAAIAGLSV